jgi:signal transduction histidine kinase
MSSTLPVQPPAGRAAAAPTAPPAADAAAIAASRQWSALVALSVFVLALLWIAVAALAEQDRRTTREQALLNLKNLSRAFAEHTTKSLEGADQAVRFIRSEYLLHRDTLDIPAYLSARAVIDDDYHLLTVIGADGYVSHSSRPFTRVDLHEREHFRVHAEGRQDRLFVSKPVLGKVSGKWSIQITRRIDEPDGRFGGVVVVSMSPDYFTSFYRDVDLGSLGSIALVGLDGVVRARASHAGAQQGMNVGDGPVFKRMAGSAEGQFESVSAVDGVARFYAFRRLPAYDLAVITGVSVDEAMADYLKRRNTMIAVAAVASAVLLWFAATLFLRIRTQRDLMRALQVSEVQAQSANRMKSNLLASVSHELRTPLNGILGYAELIRETASDPQAAQFGGIIHDSAQHLHTLVNQILDLAKLESGRMVAQLAPTPLAPLLEETHRLHKVHAESKGLVFDLVVDASSPEQIRTDRTRLVQVLSNLVNNAIKFTDRGVVTLTAALQAGEFALTVTDTGVGIPESQRASLFTRFQGIDDHRIQANQGAGLGLSLARELTELLGGSLHITSTVGSGTTARITWPLATISTAAADPGKDPR